MLIIIGLAEFKENHSNPESVNSMNAHAAIRTAKLIAMEVIAHPGIMQNVHVTMFTRKYAIRDNADAIVKSLNFILSH